MDWAACLTIRAWGARRGAAKSTLFGPSIPLFNLISSTQPVGHAPLFVCLFAFFHVFLPAPGASSLLRGLLKEGGMDSASTESFAEVEILGIYMSAAAAAGVWILKAIGDHASKKKKQQNSTRENLITRMLWNYSPAGGRYPESFY